MFTICSIRMSGDQHGRKTSPKKLAETLAEETAKHAPLPVELWATDEHRLGLKPVQRRVWAPKGLRPIALGHHRFEWLYVTAFVAPESGETVWYLSNGIDKRLFEMMLAGFARETGAGRDRIILLLLDGAGWHTEPGLAVPEGIRLIYLPPTPPNCSRPSTSGRWSTNPSPTATSTHSTRSMPCSPSAAAPSSKTATSSPPTPDSTGGQILPTRIDQPNPV
jgi:hypothetical protein